MRGAAWTFAVAALLAAGCSASSNRSELTLYRLDGFEVPYSLNSGLRAKKVLIARDDEQWQSVWRQLHGNRRPVPPTPRIDFETTMAVVFGLGAQKSGGYSVQITRAVRVGNEIHLTVAAREPSPECIVTSAITSPADVVLLPMMEGAVVVEATTILVDC